MKSHKSSWVVPDWNESNPTVKAKPDIVRDVVMSEPYSKLKLSQKETPEISVRVVPALSLPSSFHPHFAKIDFNLFKFDTFQELYE